MTEEQLIYYLCVAKNHRGSRELGLTQYEGRWALCPDILGQGHEWVATGGLAASDAVAKWKEITGLGR